MPGEAVASGGAMDESVRAPRCSVEFGRELGNAESEKGGRRSYLRVRLQGYNENATGSKSAQIGPMAGYRWRV